MARPDSAVDWLAEVASFRNIVVITGAGCSVPSGIPAYRDATGRWQHRTPITYREFRDREEVRRRYWARSALGWQRIRAASPNPAHEALAQLEHAGLIRTLVTQNVDGLHSRAGSKELIELHGGLGTVACTTCDWRGERERFQFDLLRANPDFSVIASDIAPDGDAQLDEHAYAQFIVPNCQHCDGFIKPDVVFYGEAVPLTRVNTVKDHIANCEALLVVGSSLTVFSGFRFVKLAAARGIPIAVLNRGVTRASAFGAHHLDADAEQVLPELVRAVIVARQAADQAIRHAGRSP